MTFNGQQCKHQYKPIKKRLPVLYFLLKWFYLDQWYIFFSPILTLYLIFFGYLRIWKILWEPLQCIFADYRYIRSHLSLTSINSATLPCKSRNYILNRTCLFLVLFCNLFGYCFILNHFQKVSSLKNYSWNFVKHLSRCFYLGDEKIYPLMSIYRTRPLVLNLMFIFYCFIIVFYIWIWGSTNKNSLLEI